jgi:hypothetical protein
MEHRRCSMCIVALFVALFFGCFETNEVQLFAPILLV